MDVIDKEAFSFLRQQITLSDHLGEPQTRISASKFVCCGRCGTTLLPEGAGVELQLLYAHHLIGTANPSVSVLRYVVLSQSHTTKSNVRGSQPKVTPHYMPCYSRRVVCDLDPG